MLRHNIIKLAVTGLAIFLLSGKVMAISVTTSNNATTLTNNILGLGISIVGTPTYTGAAIAAGTFTGGTASGLGFDTGIVLTSGSAVGAEGPNGNFTDSPGTTDDESTTNGQAGDADLTVLAGNDTFDATILEFVFTSTGGNLFFNYVFASEEYNEFVDAGFDDVFGFFLDGINIALIPSTTDPVSIDNVNNTTNSAFFNDNTNTGPFGPLGVDLEYDGFTSVFQAKALGLSAGDHTIKLAIADEGDMVLDTAVFIEAGSFSVTSSQPVPEPATIALLGIGLAGLAGVGARRKWKKKEVGKS